MCPCLAVSVPGHVNMPAEPLQTLNESVEDYRRWVFSGWCAPFGRWGHPQFALRPARSLPSSCAKTFLELDQHCWSSPKLSGDLDLFDETGNDHAKGGSPAAHLVGEDAGSGGGLLLQHLHHDVKAFLSRGAVLVHRASLVHQVWEAFLLHRIIDAFHLQKWVCNFHHWLDRCKMSPPSGNPCFLLQASLSPPHLRAPSGFQQMHDLCGPGTYYSSSNLNISGSFYLHTVFLRNVLDVPQVVLLKDVKFFHWELDLKVLVQIIRIPEKAQMKSRDLSGYLGEHGLPLT